MLNRSIAPAFQSVGKFSVKEVKKFRLDNGRHVFYLNHGDQEIFKIEASIRSGSLYSQTYELVPLTLKMLNEGTKSKNSTEMAEEIDSLGSFIEFNPGFDNCAVSIYGLTKHFHEASDLLREFLFEPRFDESDFSELKKRETQRLKLNQEKTSYLSSVKFRASIFGPSHPYGRSVTPDDLDKVDLSEVKEFYNSSFGDFDILVSGVLPKDFRDTLNTFFGKDDFIKSNIQAIDHLPPGPVKVTSKKEGSVQSSIRIGKRLFNRTHPDYLKFMIMNELLGGFFGSRLMKNIREEKGLSYGIYSQVYALSHSGYFSISTDVKASLTELAIGEILKEIELLQNEEVSFEELNVVKNYMLGSFSSSLGTPFALMDRFKAIHYQGLDYDYYVQYFDTINSISPRDLLNQSQRHLRLDSLNICTVGP